MIARLEPVRPAADAPRLARRLDWRFLLPDPRLRRVLHVGSRASTLGRALEAFSDSVIFPDDRATSSEIDLVVVQEGNRREVEAALPQLAPGGWLYWELRPGQTLRPADRSWLGSAGMSQVQAFWHHGGFEDRRWIIPLEHPAGLALVLKRKFPAATPSALIRIAALMVRSRTLRRTLAVSVIACRGPVSHCTTFPQRFVQAQGLRRLETGPEGSDSPYALATPTFPSSRSVVFLMTPPQSCVPTFVAKIARVESGREPLAREAANLRAVELAQVSVQTVPRLVAYAVFKGHAVLVETALAGQLMQPRLVRRRPAACIEAVMRWLEDFHSATRVAAAHCPGRITALVEPPLARLEPIVAPEPATRELLANVRRLTSRLEGLRVPLVFEHGDLSSPNLLLLGNGRAGVLDWELADPRGLPAVDLFFFLAYIAFARERATTPEQCVSAFGAAFFGRGAWARPHISRYAAVIGVPQAALAPLFLLCWSRYLSKLPARFAWAIGRDAGPDELAEVRRDRYWHLWKYAAEHVDDLENAFQS